MCGLFTIVSCWLFTKGVGGLVAIVAFSFLWAFSVVALVTHRLNHFELARQVGELTVERDRLKPYEHGLRLLSSNIAEVLVDFWSNSDRAKSPHAHWVREDLQLAITKTLVETARDHGNIDSVANLLADKLRVGGVRYEAGRGGNDLKLLVLTFKLDIEKANNERREQQLATR